MKLVVFLAAVCIVGVYSAPHERETHIHDIGVDAFCVAANMLKNAGWMHSDGTMSKKFEESNAAKECRNLSGDNACDTADRVMTCLTHKGLMTAVGAVVNPTRVNIMSPF